MRPETGFDHTLITRGASVGVIGQKRPTRIYLESATYDWFGLVRVGRTGFDFVSAQSYRQMTLRKSGRGEVREPPKDVFQLAPDAPHLKGK